jgi:hypothetical protein
LAAAFHASTHSELHSSNSCSSSESTENCPSTVSCFANLFGLGVWFHQKSLRIY